MTLSDKANDAATGNNEIHKAMTGFILQTGLNAMLDNMRKAGFLVAYADNVDLPGLRIDISKDAAPAAALSFRLILTPREGRGLNQPVIEYSRDDRPELKTLPSVLDIPAAISSWVMDNLPRVTGAAAYDVEIVKGADISPKP